MLVGIYGAHFLAALIPCGCVLLCLSAKICLKGSTQTLNIFIKPNFQSRFQSLWTRGNKNLPPVKKRKQMF